MNTNIQQFADADFCYLTTTGRVSGRPHTIEIWFALHGHTLYILAGGRDTSDWVKNIRKQAQVQVKINDTTFSGSGRILNEQGEEDALARKIVFDKYTPRDSDDLTEWARTSLPVAIDIKPV